MILEITFVKEENWKRSIPDAAAQNEKIENPGAILKNRKKNYAYNNSKHLKNIFSYLLDIIEYDFDHYL